MQMRAAREPSAKRIRREMMSIGVEEKTDEDSVWNQQDGAMAELRRLLQALLYAVIAGRALTQGLRTLDGVEPSSRLCCIRMLKKMDARARRGSADPTPLS